MNDMHRKQHQAQERLKKALMEKKKQQLMERREAYRRTQMDEFRDGMVSLVTDPEVDKNKVAFDDKAVNLEKTQKADKHPNKRIKAFKMAKRKKERAA